jgi:hypothetical protein
LLRLPRAKIGKFHLILKREKIAKGASQLEMTETGHTSRSNHVASEILINYYVGLNE